MLVAASLLCSLSTAVGAPSAATWYVDVSGTAPGTGTPGDPYTSLQFAIDEAQVVAGDTLLVAAGTYLETVDLRGKTLTLRSQAGAAATIIDAGGSGSTLTLASGEASSTLIEGFTLTGGSGTQEQSGDYRGGGVYLVNTSPLIKDCVVLDNELGGPVAFDQGIGLHSNGGSPRLEGCSFSGNRGFADRGGGAAFFGGSPQLVDCRFEDNMIGAYGGGAYFESSTPTLDGCTFERNNALWQGGGGAAFRLSVAVLTDCQFTDNSVNDAVGGGVYLEFFSTVEMFDCELVSNTALNWTDGGGAYILFNGSELRFHGGRIEGNTSWRGGGVANFAKLYVEGAVIRGNSASSDISSPNNGDGGGIWSSSGQPATQTDLVQCLIEGNQASHDNGFNGRGGGVFGPVDIDRCTLVGNQASNGGGALHEVSSLSSSIVRGNLPVAFLAPTGGTSYSNVEGGAPGTGNIDADPLFVDPGQSNYHLQPGSPSIDAGDPGAPLDPDGSIADQGAYPFEPCPPVSVYCTAGTSANGCVATLSTAGAPSAGAAAGFVVTASGVEGQKQGILFWGRVALAAPWGAGSSFLCVAAPVKRTGNQSSGGTAGTCDGALSVDFNAWMQANPNKAPQPGEQVYFQAWFRDPPSPKMTSLSDAVSFLMCP